MKFRLVFLLFFVLLVQSGSMAQGIYGNEPGFDYRILYDGRLANIYGIKLVDGKVGPDKDGYVTLWDALISKGHIKTKRPLKMMTRIKYFAGSEESLYKDIKEHKTIENCYIETLDLKKLGTLKHGVLVIMEPINIDACIIGSIRVYDDRKHRYSDADNVIFNMPVCFKHSYIEYFFLKNSAFNGSFYWLNNNNGLFRISDTRFNNVIHVIDRCRDVSYTGATGIHTAFYIKPGLRGHFSIISCIANDSVIIHTSNERKNFSLQGNSFMGPVVTNPYNPKYPGAWFFNGKRIFSEQVWNLSFDNSRFNNYVDFSNSKFHSCSFRDITFQGPLIIYNTSVGDKDTGNVNRIYQRGKKDDFSAVVFMKDNLPLICNPEFFNLDILGFSPITMAKARLDFEVNGQNDLDQTTLEKINGLLSRVNQYYTETFKDEPLAVEEIVNHSNHLKLEKQVEFLKAQPGLSFQVLWYNFLEYLVGNGYHGEVKFFPSVLLFILLFTIIYNIWFVRDVRAYILKINEKSSPNEPVAALKQKKTALSIITLVQCFWMSVIVFLNPRFPAAYFRFRNSFMIVVVIEWLIGLIMIILFLIFIASKYAFVKTLLGI